VLQFDYADHCINLLDTPGHKDFSEDTYRVLTAVDSVIMVIDAAKGIEDRTKKLFEICRLRGIPIFTFINKMDRPAQEPLALLDELEKVLGIGAFPVTWPLGNGRISAASTTASPTSSSFRHAPSTTRTSAVCRGWAGRPRRCGPDDGRRLRHLAQRSGNAVHGGRTVRPRAGDGRQITPVFFGSAMTNFGVQLLLDYFVKYGAAARPAASRANGPIPPENPAFSGFVFKVQANMNPRHRDTIAFVRVCSGLFREGHDGH
jgi:peptide chain release factor 3